MKIEKAKAELQTAMSGPAGRQWSYGPAISAVLVALEQRIAELEARIEPQEPIAWIVHARTGDRLTQDGDYVASAEDITSIHSTPLYAATPAPPVAVPDEDALKKQLQMIWWSCGDCHYMSDKTASQIVSSCRAAMHAAPVNPEFTTEWIPCSERMPEADGDYWGWWSESKRQGPAWFIKSELQAQFQSSEITHWMPLPAAPQQ